MWISHKQLAHGLTAAKKFFKNTYHEGKKWANIIDGYAGLARKGLSAAAPLLQELGGGEVLGHGVKALQGYDSVRKQVMDVEERGRGHYDRISAAVG